MYPSSLDRAQNAEEDAEWALREEEEWQVGEGAEEGEGEGGFKKWFSPRKFTTQTQIYYTKTRNFTTQTLLLL